MVNAFLHGISLALGLILPLGAQNTFIINQGASCRKYKLVLPAVVTAGLCDTFLIITATTGISQIIFLYPTIKNMMFVVAILFLFYLGYTMWQAKPEQTLRDSKRQYSVKYQVMTAMILSLLNPHAIADTVATIGTSAATYIDATEKIYFIAACIVVSWVWFFFLSISGSLLATNRIYAAYQNKISAIMIWLSCLIIMFNLQ